MTTEDLGNRHVVVFVLLGTMTVESILRSFYTTISIAIPSNYPSE